MKVCMIGFINPDDATNWRLLRAFEAMHISYVIYPMPHKVTLQSFFGALRFLKTNKKECSHIWITSISHQVIPFIYFSVKCVWPFRRPPIVHDSLISIYDTRVFDRGWVSRWSMKALYYYLLDWFACKISDCVVVDTNEHGKYFKEQFHCDSSKIRRVFAGANRERFYPRKPGEKSSGVFVVSFHGKLIPGMSGSEYLVEVARMLKKENILFRIIGKGKLLPGFEKIKKEENLENLELTSWVDPHDLPDVLAESDVIIGAFGTTPKAAKAIPLKVFEGLAMGKALLVGDSPAARELFTDKVDCLFAKRGDAQDLAEKIMLLKENKALRDSIAEKGYALYDGILGHEAIGRALKVIFTEVAKHNEYKRIL